MQVIRIRYRLLLFFLFLLNMLPQAHATLPTLLYHDPMPLYTPRCVDVLPPQLRSQDDQRDRWFSINVSAFTQEAKSSRSDREVRVPTADLFGRINACGLFFNVHEKALDDTGTGAEDPKQQYPELVAAYEALKAIPNTTEARYTKEDFFQFDYDDDFNNKDGFMSVTSSFKKHGVRTSIYIEPHPYFKFKINAGCSEYSYSGLFVSQQESADDAGAMNKLLTNPQKISDIAVSFKYDLGLVQKRGFEDMYLSAIANYPFTFYGTDKEPAVICHPFFGFGVWVPTGEKRDPNQFFSLPLGNEGFWGYGVNAGCSVHFLGMLYFSFEAAFTFFNEQVVEMRYPTSHLQQGIFPFSAQFSKTPGMSWDINFSLCGRHVIEGLSFYIDWIYAQHENDKIALPISHNDIGEEIIGTLNIPIQLATPGAPTAEEEQRKKDRTEYALSKLEDLSFWKSEIFSIGFSYEVTPALEIGLAFRGNLKGRRVTRTETILGTIKFAF